MTVCIAAAAEANKSIVLIADRMATNMNVVREAESAHKILSIKSNIYMLIAGDGVLGKEIHKAVLARVDEINTIEEAAAVAQSEYINARLARVQNLVLVPRGLTIDAYQRQQQTLEPNIAALIDQQMMQFSIDVSLLVAGVDATGARIYAVENGIYGELDSFSAIGSGSTHATNSLHARNYSPDFEATKARYLAFEAKKRSEVAPGVGVKTDMIVIEADNTKTYTDEELSNLNTKYESIMKQETKLLDEELDK